jgi:AraC-like DNA-binding protein
MKINKPSFEKINPGFGNSISVRKYADPCRDKLPLWHFHPELELVYVNGGTGKRHIGNQVSYYQNGDLIFIGSNLPHFGFTDRLTGNRSETIVQMKADFLGPEFLDVPEMASIKKLFERSKVGVTFHGQTKRRVGAMIENLSDKSSFERILTLLNILQQLSESSEYKLLHADGVGLEIEPQDSQRMNIIYAFVRENYKNPIPLSVIADKISMTEPAFCRYFKKITGKTFTQFVNECRMVQAIKLLSEQSISITQVCFESGFNNFSHFNSQFKKFTGKNPSEYRNELRQLVK